MMRGVLVKAVAETARAAYMPAVRSWAGAGRPLELVWGERDTVTLLKEANDGEWTVVLPRVPHRKTVQLDRESLKYALERVMLPLR